MAQKYKQGDRVVIHSKTSHNNGKVVTVKNYTNGKCNDILLVEKRDGTAIMIKEGSLRPASRYDEIRNLKDRQIDRLLETLHRKELS